MATSQRRRRWRGVIFRFFPTCLAGPQRPRSHLEDPHGPRPHGSHRHARRRHASRQMCVCVMRALVIRVFLMCFIDGQVGWLWVSLICEASQHAGTTGSSFDSGGQNSTLCEPPRQWDTSDVVVTVELVDLDRQRLTQSQRRLPLAAWARVGASISARLRCVPSGAASWERSIEVAAAGLPSTAAPVSGVPYKTRRAPTPYAEWHVAVFR